MEIVIRHIAVLPLAYLLGAFPTGYLLVRLFTGQDVRKLHSGRTGGTNVLRSAGPVAAFLTIVGDGLKGGAAVLLARAVGSSPLAMAIAGVAAIVGHNYSVFLSWRGGAGTITSIGVALFIHPLVGAVAIGFGAIVLLLTRYASAASIAVALALPVLYGVQSRWGNLPGIFYGYAAISALVVLLGLRRNIGRLLAGTERKVGIPAR